MKINRINTGPLALFMTGLLGTPTVHAQQPILEEIVVTAEKREASLQETPIAITAIGPDQLRQQGIFSIDDFRRGLVPQVQVQTLPINPWTLHITIRGIGNLDVSQLTRESPVAVYMDSVYLGRAQGLAMEVADLSRIEILRGPQGTLFGRNAMGGALSLVTEKPSGDLGLVQTLSFGNYDYFKSITHLDLPEVAGISTKIDYFTSDSDGWVDNTAPGEDDFGMIKKRGGRLALRWEPSDKWTVDYSYDRSEIEGTSNYFRYEQDPAGLVGGPEPDRVTRSRIPTPFVDPSEDVLQGHSLTVEWEINKDLIFKSISAYRTLDEDNRTNFGGAFGVGWFSPSQNSIDQEQWSQEFQLVGNTGDGSIEYVAGLYYFKEETEEFYVGNGYLIPDFTNSFPDLHIGNTMLVYSQDLFGIPSYPSQFVNGFTVGLTGNPALLDLSISDARNVESEAESPAAYGQITWTPREMGLENRLHITGGVRYSKDKKSGTRHIFMGVPTGETFDLDENHVDGSLTVSWDWTDSVNTYIKWSTAYQGGGANIRSESFRPFDAEEAKSWELGLKSEWWNRRVRVNAAAFYVEYEDLQLDFVTPTIQTETVNASRGSEISGFELEVTATPTEGLLFNLSYNYLDWDMPLQPNTTVPGSPLERFDVPEAPRHAGALSGKYTIAELPVGTLSLYLNVTSRSKMFSSSRGYFESYAFTLVNGRISLADIPLGRHAGSFEVAIWGNNLMDQEYNANIVNTPPELVLGQGEPRMYGVDFTYRY